MTESLWPVRDPPNAWPSFPRKRDHAAMHNQLLLIPHNCGSRDSMTGIFSKYLKLDDTFLDTGNCDPRYHEHESFAVS